MNKKDIPWAVEAHTMHGKTTLARCRSEALAIRLALTCAAEQREADILVREAKAEQHGAAKLVAPGEPVREVML